LLHSRPNGEMTAMSFREAMLIQALLSGDSYAEIERRADGGAFALWPLSASRVTLVRSGGALKYRVAGENGGTTFIDSADVLHLHGPGIDGLSGFNVVQKARQAIGAALAMERFGGTFFKNGSQFGGILSHPQRLGDDGLQNLRTSINARHGGTANAHKYLVLEEGISFTPVGVAPENAQFNESRVHQIREIARFFKMPPQLLGDLERSTFSNHEQAMLSYYTQTLAPWLRRFEQECASKLLLGIEREHLIIEHVVEGFLRGAHTERAAFYASMLSHGAMTINEVRARENLPPVPGGDQPRVPLNTEPVGQPRGRMALPGGERWPGEAAGMDAPLPAVKK
jgi:HK97 family phage portal protein